MRPHFCESPFYREKVASLTESLPFEFGRPHFRTLSTFPTFSAEMSVQILFEIGFQHFNFWRIISIFRDEKLSVSKSDAAQKHAEDTQDCLFVLFQLSISLHPSKYYNFWNNSSWKVLEGKRVVSERGVWVPIFVQIWENPRSGESVPISANSHFIAKKLQAKNCSDPHFCESPFYQERTVVFA